MLSSHTPDPRVAEVARRRLEELAAQLEAGEVEPVPASRAPDLSVTGVDLGLVVAAGSSPPSPGRHARRSLPAGPRLRDWMSDRLPPTLQGRLALGPAQVGLLAALAAGALLVATWWVGGAQQETVVPARSTSAAVVSTTPVSLAPGGASPAVTAPAADAVSASSEAVVVVDVAGRVARPGIVVLPVGSRVVDALKAAGGARRGVDLTTLNLARLVSDGEQILVGVPAAPGVAAGLAPGTVPAAGGLVNLNSADARALETLPGVGPVTAAAILAWREENGAFTSVDELLEVSGIGEKTLAQIAPHLTL